VRAGEASGSMGNVLMRLAEHMERSKELKDSVVSALVYPVILLFVAALSVIVLLMFVVPQFKQIFDQSGKALPWSTQLVLDSASLLRNDWPIILGVILATIWLFNRSLNNPKSRRGWDLRFLKMNLVGKLVTKVEMARFSRSLATLITNGVPLLAGLSILRETMGNIIFSEAVEHVSRELKEGRGLSKPMLETQIFPKLAVQMIAVGEETGKLDEMLFQVADVYDREVASTIKRILALIQPVMIMGLALLIGAIIMSLLVAMFGMMDLPT
jgi:general secretion pathway protein F